MPPIEPWTRYLPAFLRERLEGRPNLWRILTNIGWLFGDQLLRMGVGLFVGVLVARHLGPAEFGLLNYAIAFVGLLTPLALLGLDNVVVRDLVHDPQRSQETLGTAFGLKLLSGGLTWALAVGVMLVKPGDPDMHLLVGLVGATLVFQAFDTVALWFQSQVRSKYTVIARNASFIVVATVRIALVLTAAPLTAFAAAIALEAALGAAALVVVYRASGQRLRAWTATRARAAALLHTSWPLILSGLAVAVYMRVDQIMLGEIRGDEELGIYASAVRISELWYFIPSALVASVAPTVINAKKTDAVLYGRRMQQLLNTLALLGYSIALPLTLLAGPLVRLLYGAEFAAAGPPLAIHIWAGLFVGLGIAEAIWWVNEGLTRIMLVSTTVGAVLNITLNFLLIEDYGALGAAIATLISYGVTVTIINLCYGPTRPLGRMVLKALFLRR